MTVTGAKLRSLLAMLALRAGRVVPAEQLVEGLWGDNPPAEVRNGLQGLASKLRRALGSADLVVMRGEGYVLELAPDDVDIGRFEQLVADGRAHAAAGEFEAAAERLTEAEAIWRGDPLADFAYDDFAAGTITRLSELRLAVAEERLDLELRLGHHHRAIVELEQLVAAHPLREGLRGLLMLALYRGGRQADALRVFREGRRILGEELGLEPGPELRRLESAILTQDPTLAAPAATGPGRRPTHRSARGHPRGADAAGRSRRRGARARGAVRRPSLHHPRRPRGRGQDPAGAGGRTARGRRAELRRAAWSSSRRSAIRPACRLRSPRRWTCSDPTRLAEMIGEQDRLIVLDNCEHVIAAAAEMAEDLLRRCPGLRILATSREGCASAARRSGPSRRCPPTTPIRLFVDRARSAGAAIELADERTTSSPTSAPGSTGCRWRSSWRRPAPARSRSPRSPPASTTGSAC